MSLAAALALAFAIGCCIAGWEAISWRIEAERLNDENLELAEQVDTLERADRPRPQIVRGPVVESRASEVEWSDLISNVQALRSDFPNGARVVPLQRRGGERP